MTSWRSVWAWLTDRWRDDLYVQRQPSIPPDPIDLDDPTRRQAIRNAEYDQRAQAVSKVQRITGQPEHRVPLRVDAATGAITQREGRLVRFVRAGDVLGRPCYRVLSTRGGFGLGELLFRSQWGCYAYYPHAEAMLNMECLAEIYAMLRELRGLGVE